MPNTSDQEERVGRIRLVEILKTASEETLYCERGGQCEGCAISDICMDLEDLIYLVVRG